MQSIPQLCVPPKWRKDMYHKSLLWIGLMVLLTFLSFLAGCSRQPLNGELGSSACPTVATTYYIRQDGNNTNLGTANSAGGAWKTIQYAVSFSCLQAGDTIKVIPGVSNAPYNETVTITKSGTAQNRISLVGNSTGTQAKIAYTGATQNSYNKAAILLKPANADSTDPTQASIIGWTIQGFRIEGGTDTTRKATTGNASAGPAANGIPYIYDGIAALKAKNITIISNSIFRTGASGIAVRPFFSSVSAAQAACPTNPNPPANPNDASWYYTTACAVQSSGISIIGNTVDTPNVGILNGSQIQLSQEAISLEGVYYFEIYTNTVINRMKEGIDVKVGGHDGFIRDNTVTGSTQILGGPAIYIEGQRAPSYNIDVYRNKIYDSRSSGITITTEHAAYNSSGATSVTGTVNDCNSTCTSTTTGVIDVHDISVFSNLVYNNGDSTLLGRGLGISGQVRNVDVYNNTFANNYRPFQFGNDPAYGGYYSQNITVRNNIFSGSNPGGQGFIYKMNNVKFENNLFTGTYTYDIGTGTTGVTPTGNACSSNSTGPCPNNPNTQADETVFNKLNTGTIFDTGTNNYQLTTGSPAIRAGSTAIPTVHPNTPSSDATKDYAASTRPQPTGTRPDIGAYESPN
jgi:hypothetical protein